MNASVVTVLVLSGLLSTACAGFTPVAERTPHQAAKAECETWLQRHNLMQRPRMGTQGWDNAIELCVAKHEPWVGTQDALVSRQPKSVAARD